MPSDASSTEPALAGRPAVGGDGVFAVLPAGRTTWAVASVHGESGRLRALHARLAARITPLDNLVYLGNFLGRGDDVGGTVQELLLFRRALMATQTIDDPGAIAYLRGRQEEMWHKLLQVQFAPDPRAVLEWMLAQGVGPTLTAYGGNADEARRIPAMGAKGLSQWTNRLRASMRARDGHDQLMSVVRRAAFTVDQTLLLVSAGIDAARPLSEQTDSFWWGGRGFDEIEAPYGGFRRVVRGYDYRRRGVWFKEWTASIDAGCGYDGPLVAAGFAADGALIDTIEV